MGWRKSVLDRTFAFSDFTNPESIVTSYFVSPVVLILYRVIFLAFAIFILCSDFVVSRHVIGAGQMYFTVMSYEFLIIHFGLCLIMSFILKSWQFSRNYSKEESLSSSDLMIQTNGKLVWFAKVTVLISEIITCNVAVVVLVYWLLLSDPQPNAFQTFVNLSVHGLNWPLIWIDMALNKIRFHKGHIVYEIILLFFYMCFAFVFHASYNVWIYSFLDYYNSAKAAVYYIGVFIGFVIIYFIALGWTRLRDYIGKRMEADKTRDIPMTQTVVVTGDGVSQRMTPTNE